ncbi:hypothetical protein [Ferruginibacter sp.]|uniref:hypothetical protein n=1 Tax=Ferruginibacter sp. TaxID=1940288 RepID=UPI002657D35A|nr:hypothetical protein [Ferruginibacter sp.]
MRNFKKIYGYTFIIAAILFGIGFVLRFKYLTNQEAEKFLNEKFINKKIRGHLLAIVKYKQDKVVLGIDNHEEFELTYGTLCIDSSFLKNIQEKDSVFKDVGEDYLNFINKEVKQSRLKVIFCDL